MTLGPNNKWKARALVLGVFLLGCAIGALTMNLYRVSVQSGRFLTPSPPRHTTAREKHLDFLTRELGLSEDQARQVGQILDETRQEFIQLRNEMRPRFDAIRDRSRERIRALLTPEQQAKYAELMKRLDEERSGREGRERR